MSNRTEFRRVLALLMLFAGAEANAQKVVQSQPAELVSAGPGDSTAYLRGTISTYDSEIGILSIGDVQVFVGDAAATVEALLAPGDQIVVFGNLIESSGFIWASSVERAPEPGSQTITGTGVSTQSITGTGIRAQSITGTGVRAQSITGTGVRAQSITGTGISTQSITGTGISTQSITGTGIRAQSITGTGVRAQSITGTGVRAQSITGTGISTQSITGTGISTQSITGTGSL